MSQHSWIEAGLANPQLLDEIYAKYQSNPNSVDSSWYFAFTGQTPGLDKAESAVSSECRIRRLIDAYRMYGHLAVKVNPIETASIEEPWELNLATLGFNSEEFTYQFPTCGLLSANVAPLQLILETLKNIYCSRIGYEYMGLDNQDLEKWLQGEIEKEQGKISLSSDQKQTILQYLNRSELFEHFIHTKYTGQKRFSLEGGETLIPMLERVMETGSDLGVSDFYIGMAHRGRLNVLSNILNKSHVEIFSEFEETYIPNSFEGSGDVKYHNGFFSDVTTSNGHQVKITLAPNPSHLESVDPVVEGQVLARQMILNDEQKQEKVIPILIHGDAAIAGQGVVYETMQLSKVPGYATGGTLHFVVNNQIGFTATPAESRSTHYCTDIAKTFSAPVFHVNAEDPESCVYVSHLAMQIRQKFGCDVFVDLNAYRKYGHNESDEPAYTQPLEYQLIRKKRPIREIYRDQLIHEGVVEKQIAESLETEFTQALNQALQEIKEGLQKQNPQKEERVVPEKFQKLSTGVPKDVLKSIAQKISEVPDGFTIHPKLQLLVQERLSTVLEEKKPIEWGTAELLAYGSLLWEGKSVRLSGQDSRRGTFSHRHAIWVDQTEEKIYCPLQHLNPIQGRFDVLNSPLSEFAVLGFEYGYSVGNPEALVIWEAQFGDFCNGAQVIIDQYISTSEQKWGQPFRLVLFLPHGYEGQGPEHSSGRMERFLALSGEDNMRIANPTTPAQFFHLLRNQELNPLHKPLIVFTPKGLLRHPACVSSLQELSEGSFKTVLDDPNPPKPVQRILFCSGRVYYDLDVERKEANDNATAIVRIEQLAPFDREEVKAVIKKYPESRNFIWVQEEPQNMGTWEYIRPQLQEILSKHELEYVGRPRSASPAVGSYHLHKKQYAEIMQKLFHKDKR